jgi:hypothetical protein
LPDVEGKVKRAWAENLGTRVDVSHFSGATGIT